MTSPSSKTGTIFSQRLVLIIFNGQTAVVIFFILSGAVLFESLQRENGSISSVVGKFLIRDVFFGFTRPWLFAF